MSPDAPQGPRYPSYPGEQQPGGADPTHGTPWSPPAQPDVRPGVQPGAPSFPDQADRSVPEKPAGWWIRVLASFVDGLIVLALSIVPIVGGFVLLFVDADYDEVTDEFTNTNPWGLVVVGLGFAVYLGFDLWNRGLRVGYRGQSLGKQLVGVHVVGRDGAPVGALEGFFRWLVAGLLQWTFIGLLVDLLWPLWDERKQTVHDKAINTYPVRR
ncbi:MAG: RDD family protein [Actinomycetales bacterium]|nr:MAG: RDD family protein [Actinomycetales bacterium]